ncbi:hypothetical protein [Pseudomonas sp. zfem002]|uniref:hypothetical protein n=1 Tax=Pseudomonas sp. zfem002 TaxID=3078197 RepID=UPI0029298BB0|nr:hypothetical protein [Pseudomonas sp. zfem002]MDU9391717.1 hypothetical protein [Pseudomonas sp. zfem002]
MSSSSKQQKRAKRAAAKAKQNRMVRNGTAAPKAEVDLDAPLVNDLIRIGFESGHYQKLFKEMNEAEKTSLAEVFSLFFRDPLTDAVEDTYTDEYSYYVESLFCAYHHWLHNSTREEATAWYLSEEVQDAFMDGAELAAMQYEQDDAFDEELVLPPIDELIMKAFDSGHYEELYEKMQEAQKTSLVNMFTVFCHDPMTILVEDGYDEDSFAIYAKHVISIYHQWVHDSSKEEATEWALSDDILESYEQALSLPRPDEK